MCAHTWDGTTTNMTTYPSPHRFPFVHLCDHECVGVRTIIMPSILVTHFKACNTRMLAVGAMFGSRSLKPSHHAEQKVYIPLKNNSSFLHHPSWWKVPSYSVSL